MKKVHCGECVFLTFVNEDGLGYCNKLEESDVSVTDEACSSFIQDEGKEDEE